MNSPFVYLRCFIQDLSTSGNGKDGSEQISEGVSICHKPPTQDVQQFLSILRFDSSDKVNALGRYADPEASKTDNQGFESPFY